MKTYTYKTVGDVDIKADVYRPEDAKICPVVVHVHGGALISGSRANGHENILDPCLEAGYIVVSIDYRLAPEVKIPAIIEDLQDAMAHVL